MDSMAFGPSDRIAHHIGAHTCMLDDEMARHKTHGGPFRHLRSRSPEAPFDALENP